MQVGEHVVYSQALMKCLLNLPVQAPSQSAFGFQIHESMDNSKTEPGRTHALVTVLDEEPKPSKQSIRSHV